MDLQGEAAVGNNVMGSRIVNFVRIKLIHPVSFSMELHRVHADPAKGSSSGTVNPNSIPLAQLLKNPQALSALSTITGIPGLSSLSNILSADTNRNQKTPPKFRPQALPANGTAKDKKAKFSPY